MRKLLFGALFTGFFLFLVTPLATFANTATLNSIIPFAVTISEGGEEPSPGTFLEVFDSATFGQSYTAVFDVDLEPAMVVITGGEMDSWSYDAGTGQVTVNCTHTGFVQGAGNFGPTNPFGIAIVWPENNLFDGPPTEMMGGWMSTNLIQWNLIPPNEEEGKAYFGYEMSGPAGEQAFFSMFIPDATLDYLTEIKGSPLTFEDMALFINGGQANVSYTDKEGGVEVFIEVTFKKNTTQVASVGEFASTVSKRITYKKKKRLSIVATKHKVKKGNKTKLRGWLTTKKNKKKENKKIVIKRRLPNEKYEKWKVVKTNKRGYYSKRFTVNKTANYRAIWNKTKKTKWKSDKIKVTQN